MSHRERSEIKAAGRYILSFLSIKITESKPAAQSIQEAGTNKKERSRGSMTKLPALLRIRSNIHGIRDQCKEKIQFPAILFPGVLSSMKFPQSQ